MSPTLLGNRLGWEAAVREERVLTRHGIREERGEDFQRAAGACSLQTFGCQIPPQEKERWMSGRHFSQSLAPLLALKTLHGKLSLLQICLLLCMGTSVLFTGEEENTF